VPTLNQKPLWCSGEGIGHCRERLRWSGSLSFRGPAESLRDSPGLPLREPETWEQPATNLQRSGGAAIAPGGYQCHTTTAGEGHVESSAVRPVRHARSGQDRRGPRGGRVRRPPHPDDPSLSTMRGCGREDAMARGKRRRRSPAPRMRIVR